MSELTDAELEVAVAEAMGRRLVDSGEWGSPRMWVDSQGRERWSVYEWEPLKKDKDGNPTALAAAQLWEIETWLLLEQGFTLFIYNAQEEWPFGVRALPYGEQGAASLARALCLAVMAARKEGR